ncbi:hypothetical protein ACFE04_000027 [Oxalis oulophora]
MIGHTFCNAVLHLPQQNVSAAAEQRTPYYLLAKWTIAVMVVSVSVSVLFRNKPIDSEDDVENADFQDNGRAANRKDDHRSSHSGGSAFANALSLHHFILCVGKTKPPPTLPTTANRRKGLSSEASWMSAKIAVYALVISSGSSPTFAANEDQISAEKRRVTVEKKGQAYHHTHTHPDKEEIPQKKEAALRKGKRGSVKRKKMINGEKNEEHDEINGASKALILYKIDNQCRKIIWKILKANMETLSSQQKKKATPFSIARNNSSDGFNCLKHAFRNKSVATWDSISAKPSNTLGLDSYRKKQNEGVMGAIPVHSQIPTPFLQLNSLAEETVDIAASPKGKQPGQGRKKIEKA